jgi:hypothetical protein
VLPLARRVTRHGACASRRRKGVRADWESEGSHDRVAWCPPENALKG